MPYHNNNHPITYTAYINHFIYPHLLGKKIPTSPKHFPFSIQNNLYCAAFSLIIPLTDFPLNLASCTQ